MFTWHYFSTRKSRLLNRLWTISYSNNKISNALSRCNCGKSYRFQFHTLAHSLIQICVKVRRRRIRPLFVLCGSLIPSCICWRYYSLDPAVKSRFVGTASSAWQHWSCAQLAIGLSFVRVRWVRCCRVPYRSSSVIRLENW